MASIQGIYLALFGRPVDPGGLAYWNEVTNGGQDLSKLIGGLTSSSEYLDRFEGQTSEQIVTSIYTSLFGRAPDAGGLAFFVDALESGSVERIAIQILDGAQGEDLIVVQNKEEAADIFTASLDTPEEIAAYVGEAAAAQARDLIDDVTADPASIPTPEQIEQAIEDIADGETETPPAGGGGGDPGPTPLQQFLGEWTALDAVYVTTAIGSPARAEVNMDFIELGVRYAQYLLANNLAFTTQIVKTDAAGRSQSLHDNLLGNITSVAAADRNLTTELNALMAAAPGTDIFKTRAYFDGNLAANTDAAARAFAFDVLNDVNRADVNANGFLSIWTPLDADYALIPNGTTVTNQAFAWLGAAYADYLKEGGSSAAFASIQVKGVVDAGGDDGIGRYQTLHDNLLGNISSVATGDRGTTTLVQTLLGTTVASEFGSRAYYSGDASAYQGTAHDAVRVFDYAHGYVRPDYVSQAINAVVSETAQEPNTTDLIVGTGIPATGFSIVSHEGAGAELALGIIYRQGPTQTAAIENGVITFHVANGPQSTANGSFQNQANRAAWNFNASATEGLNGSNKDITFKLFLDTDETAGVNFVDVTSILATQAPGVLQESSNYAFFSNLIDIDDATTGVQPYAFGDGRFDIKLEAYDGVTLIASNTIAVVVGDGIA